MAICFNVAQWLRESLNATLILIGAEFLLITVAGYLFWWIVGYRWSSWGD